MICTVFDAIKYKVRKFKSTFMKKVLNHLQTLKSVFSYKIPYKSFSKKNP